MKSILIFLHSGHIFKFKGKYLREMETEKWHYYEDDQGNIIHFPKDNFAAVVEGNSVERYMPTELSDIMPMQINPKHFN
ncbi:MAG: hypothetical protein KKC55_16935 [Gammaproteobacteria bacterium]|nr:hypothetical protein [Gammaproteobacteria bacterium]